VSKIEAELFSAFSKLVAVSQKKKRATGQLNVLSVFRFSDHQIRKIEAQQSSHPVPGAVLNCVFCPTPLSGTIMI
jgi:hypothetical protein